jgi:hypothetical protein
MVVASMAQTAKSDLLDQLATVTSQGEPAFSLAGCIYEGTICADQGTCVNSTCVCYAEREGEYCERKKSTTSHTHTHTHALARAHNTGTHSRACSSLVQPTRRRWA